MMTSSKFLARHFELNLCIYKKTGIYVKDISITYSEYRNRIEISVLDQK